MGDVISNKKRCGFEVRYETLSGQKKIVAVDSLEKVEAIRNLASVKVFEVKKFWCHESSPWFNPEVSKKNFKEGRRIEWEKIKKLV